MPLINHKKEPSIARQRRHAAVLLELYELLENKTDFNHSASKYVTPGEHHAYLKVLQMMHVINRSALEQSTPKKRKYKKRTPLQPIIPASNPPKES